MKLLCVQVIKDLIGSEIDVSAVLYLWFPIITEEKHYCHSFTSLVDFFFFVLVRKSKQIDVGCEVW